AMARVLLARIAKPHDKPVGRETWATTEDLAKDHAKKRNRERRSEPADGRPGEGSEPLDWRQERHHPCSLATSWRNWFSGASTGRSSLASHWSRPFPTGSGRPSNGWANA